MRATSISRQSWHFPYVIPIAASPIGLFPRLVRSFVYPRQNVSNKRSVRSLPATRSMLDSTVKGKKNGSSSQRVGCASNNEKMKGRCVPDSVQRQFYLDNTNNLVGDSGAQSRQLESWCAPLKERA
jgi:hypothetical protein